MQQLIVLTGQLLIKVPFRYCMSFASGFMSGWQGL